MREVKGGCDGLGTGLTPPTPYGIIAFRLVSYFGWSQAGFGKQPALLFGGTEATEM